MTFRETFYQVKQLLVNKLHDFGILSANMNMGWTTLLTIEQNTRITIDVPLNLTYTDEFLITGALETSTYSRLYGKTVKLKVGNTVVTTTTTNANGEYSFTQSPVSTGTHSFQVIFEGTDIYTSSESSIITRIAGKETSVMNLDARNTKHYGESVFLSGTLLTDDGEPVKNASIKYYINDSLFRTLTTGNSGEFNLTITINSFDKLLITAVYEGDSNYTAATANQTIEVYQPVLKLTSDKDVYMDYDVVTITAQYCDDAPTPWDLSIPNKEVTFTYPIFEEYNNYLEIPTQYDSFKISFKSPGDIPLRLKANGELGEGLDYDIKVDIPSNTTSQFKLVWKKDEKELKFYQDDILLENSITLNFYGDNVPDSFKDPIDINRIDLDVDWLSFIESDELIITDIKTETISEHISFTDGYGKASFEYSDGVDYSNNVINIKAITYDVESTEIDSLEGNIILTNILWQPLLDGSTGATYKYSYSEANGEGVGKGFTLNGGFPNEGLWELSFDFKHDNLRYTGIEFLAPINTNGTTNAANVGSWEGSWPSGAAYASITNQNVNWFDVKVIKIDETHVRLISNTLNRDTTVTVTWLPRAPILTCGARHNPTSGDYGPCRIRNVKVIRYS